MPLVFASSPLLQSHRYEGYTFSYGHAIEVLCWPASSWLFDIGRRLFETVECYWVVFDPKLRTTLLEIGFDCGTAAHGLVFVGFVIVYKQTREVRHYTCYGEYVCTV